MAEPLCHSEGPCGHSDGRLVSCPLWLFKVTMIGCDVDVTVVGVCQKSQTGKPWGKGRNAPVGPSLPASVSSGSLARSDKN